MSNYLAIATVTAAFKKLLQDGISEDLPGAQVTTMRPDGQKGNVTGASINLYLYFASPNAAWRNADLRTRRPKGDLTKQGQAALDLFYILTFYGNEQQFEPQRLLGSVIQTLVDRPVLTQAMIRNTILNGDVVELRDSTLGDQVQLVRFLPHEITTEELSRVWSIFFQTPYSLSFAYKATAILIQGRKPGKAPLPIRRRSFYASPISPTIEKVECQGLPHNIISLEGHLRIQGKQLQGERTYIQIGEARLTPTLVSETEVEVTMSALSSEEVRSLRAGAQGVKVLQLASSRADNVPDISTNLVPIVLCPTIVDGSDGIQVSSLQEMEDDTYRATLTLQVDLRVIPSQKAFIILNGTSGQGNAASYIFRSDRRIRETNQLTFRINHVEEGDYLIRVEIDGAESPLEVDNEEESSTFEQYVGPTVNLNLDL